MCRVEGPISEADVETVVDLILLEQSLGKKISSKSDLLHLDKYQVIRLGYLGNFLCCKLKVILIRTGMCSMPEICGL